MALALDEPTDADEKMENQGFTFCIAKDLLEKIKGVTIDLTYMGFTVDPEEPLASAGGGCSSCGSGCGSH